MTAPSTEAILLGLVLANLVGLNFKIVWEWLRSHRAEEGKGGVMCPIHEACRPVIDDVKQKVGRHEVLIQEHHADIFRELAKGEKNFDVILEAVGSLRTSYASVREAIESMRRDHDKLESRLDKLKGAA
jgi:hypothetical protein